MGKSLHVLRNAYCRSHHHDRNKLRRMKSTLAGRSESHPKPKRKNCSPRLQFDNFSAAQDAESLDSRPGLVQCLSKVGERFHRFALDPANQVSLSEAGLLSPGTKLDSMYQNPGHVWEPNRPPLPCLVRSVHRYYCAVRLLRHVFLPSVRLSLVNRP